MNKRHAKPTTAQLSNRIYRMLLEMYRDFDVIKTDIRHLTSGQQMLSERLETVRGKLEIESQGQAHLRVTCRTLVDHCARLLREKETLMKLRQANHFMADAPVRERRPIDCSVAHLHRLGIECALCGWNGAWNCITEETAAAIRDFIDDSH